MVRPSRYARNLLIAGSCVGVSLAQAEQALDEIVIVGESKLVEQSVTLEGDALRVANTGDFLKSVPGADLNRNGPITALPQYRGASGDRVNVMVDGMPVVAGGPNAMDAPVSSVPGANVKTLSVSRGIASVSAGQETLGGHVSVVSRQGEFGSGESFTAHGRINTLYSSNGDGVHASALGYVTNSSHKLGAASSYQDGDNAEFAGDKEIPNSFFRRNRLNAFYGYQGEGSGFDVDITRINTENTGTAALPMDITYVDSDQAHAEGYHQIGDWELSLALGNQRIEHGMDNYDHRQAPVMNMGMMSMPMRRSVYAEGEHDNGKLSFSGPVVDGTLTLGTDYSSVLHNAVITDPDNASFFLDNFKDAEREIQGWFAEWVQVNELWSWELGARLNRVKTDADPVAADGAPAMVAMNMMPLVSAFNQAEREHRGNNLDAVAKLAFALNDDTSISAGIARKTRTPSYQERYLWAPLQATGGLADGRNYVGNLDLDNEVAKELNLGLDISNHLNLSFQVFYRQVDDYIQGTTAITSPFVAEIQALSNMMGGLNALQFNNVDAELYGADLGYNGTWGERLYYRGTLSYVRGKRDDVDDNLYRIAPLTHTLTVGADFGQWDLGLTSELTASQDQVSAYNNEQSSAGYGLLHFNARWQHRTGLQFVVGVDNLFDKEHTVHLNGYNRVANADLPRGERLPGPSRNIRLGLSYRF